MSPVSQYPDQGANEAQSVALKLIIEYLEEVVKDKELQRRAEVVKNIGRDTVTGL